MPNAGAATSAARARRNVINKPNSPRTLIAPKTAARTTLILKEKIMANGDSGRVVDANGNLVFEIVARRIAFAALRVVKDAHGAEIGQVRRKRTPSIHKTTYLGTMDEPKKILVKSSGTVNATKATMRDEEFSADIVMGDGGGIIGDRLIGVARGNWESRSFVIALHKNRVAQVSRVMPGHVLEEGSYCVQIGAHVDSAFVMMVILALDEMYDDKRSMPETGHQQQPLAANLS